MNKAHITLAWDSTRFIATITTPDGRARMSAATESTTLDARGISRQWLLSLHGRPSMYTADREEAIGTVLAHVRDTFDQE